MTPPSSRRGVPLRRYSVPFMKRAILLADAKGSMAASRELNMPEETLRNWCKRANMAGRGRVMRRILAAIAEDRRATPDAIGAMLEMPRKYVNQLLCYYAKQGYVVRLPGRPVQYTLPKRSPPALPAPMPVFHPHYLTGSSTTIAQEPRV